jgi:hypothetical protein
MLRGARTILDIGVREGSVMKNIKQLGWEGLSTGVDIFLPNLLKNDVKKEYDNLVCCDARYLPFREKSVDVVLMLEVLEHMGKDEAIKVLNYIEKVAKIGIIVSTPVGWYHQEAMYGNPFEEHKSAFIPSELRDLGFKVYGYGFRSRNAQGKPLRHGSLNRIFFSLSSVIAFPILLKAPEFAERMVALKYISQEPRHTRSTAENGSSETIDTRDRC